MLQLPTNGQRVFECSIYNKAVRSLVKENQSHEIFDDKWADDLIHDVVAVDEDDARRLISERYSPDDGFVINAVVQTDL
ncbi:MAG: hypothetical protein HN377_09125 [Alphaproteobacteria bacterium]|jgi:hypothetical protein|nr:hypothetical protein [Alphaproteobacteria bacterium]MBT7941744.1 hypothetical protein [Alphaproteobacteria bacterium]